MRKDVEVNALCLEVSQNFGKIRELLEQMDTSDQKVETMVDHINHNLDNVTTVVDNILGNGRSNIADLLNVCNDNDFFDIRMNHYVVNAYLSDGFIGSENCNLLMEIDLQMMDAVARLYDYYIGTANLISPRTTDGNPLMYITYFQSPRGSDMMIGLAQLVLSTREK